MLKKLINMVMSNFNMRMLEKEHVGKTYTWKSPLSSETVGDETRCTGIRVLEHSGEICLDLTHGMPVPVHSIDRYLSPTSKVSVVEPERVPENMITEQPQKPVVEQRVVPDTAVSSQQYPSNQQNVGERTVKQTDIFSNFNTSLVDLNLKLKVQIPDANLLRVMYDNSANKDDFASSFAQYIKESITIDSINEAVVLMLVKKPKNRD